MIDSVLGIAKGAHFTETLRFFIFEFPKVLMLLVLIIFFVGILRSFFTPERTRKALEGKKYLKLPQILTFIAIVGGGIIVVGFLFNFIFLISVI